jgi:predicted nucleic acid-binding protein
VLLDTNIVIYACQPGGEWLPEWTDAPETSIASVTRIEALGFPGISRDEEQAIRGFLGNTICLALDDSVIELAISLRKNRKMAALDAVIAATALEYDLTLITRNVDDFKNVESLKLINPFENRQVA